MGLFGSGGIGNKDLQTTNNNESNYNWQDNGLGAGDNSVVGGGDVTVTTTDGGASRAAVDAAANVAGMALGTAVNAQTLAANSLSTVDRTVLTSAQLLGYGIDTVGSAFNTMVAGNRSSITAALDAAVKAQKDAQTYSANMADSVLAASRAAATLAANAASDAIAANQRSTASALNFADSALMATINGQRTAFTFADDALLATTNAQRTAFGFASDALLGSLSTSSRAMSTAENALDSSLSFARLSDASNTNFLEGMISQVMSLVKTNSAAAQGDAQATRDFAGAFVGDFYESQKSGDVQTIQNTVKYAAAVAIVVALAWAMKGKI